MASRAGGGIIIALTVMKRVMIMRFPARLVSLSAVAAILLGCASLVAQAIPVPQPRTDLAAIPGGVYEMDASHASVMFEITHMNFSTYVGRFNSIAAKLTFDPKAPEASTAEVTVDPASIDSNNAVLEGRLRSSEFFDVQKYPAMAFKANRLEITGPTTGKLMGQLTMHGVTRPLVLDVTFRGGAKAPLSGAFTLGFAATGQLKRSDYGITAFVPLVSDDVTIRVNAEFVKI